MKVKHIDFNNDSDLSILIAMCEAMQQGNFIVLHRHNTSIQWLEDTLALFHTEHGMPYSNNIILHNVAMMYQADKATNGIHGTAEDAYNKCRALARVESYEYYIVHCGSNSASDVAEYIEHCIQNNIPIPIAS